jgi:hypothetical protein
MMKLSTIWSCILFGIPPFLSVQVDLAVLIVGPASPEMELLPILSKEK